MENVKIIDFDGVYIERKNGGTTLGYRTVPQKMRAEFLLSHETAKKDRDFVIKQTPVFKTLGLMLDVSRGGVLTTDTVKEIVYKMATLGMNTLMLYTEDIYTMEEYPTFGYMRGRYSKAELCEIDDYAASLGVEVIPCIQTLSHLEKFLRWGDVPSDSDRTLLPDDDKVYEFIECEIRTMKETFRSRRIHVGMDEAHDLGRGNFLNHHPYEERSQIFRRHLARVLEITRKYGYEPMIWSDMCYGGHYGDPSYRIPDEMREKIPHDVSLVYWDYYHTDYETYHSILKEQMKLPNHTAFAGGIWTFEGLLPQYKQTTDTMFPAMRAAVDLGVDTVFACSWGDDGCACDMRLDIPALALFSEYGYRGKDCTEEDVYEIAEAISGMNRELWDAIAAFGYDKRNGTICYGKILTYADPLIDTVGCDLRCADVIPVWENALSVLEKYRDNPIYAYAVPLYRYLIGKAKIVGFLPDAYQTGDRATLERARDEWLPDTIRELDAFYAEFTRVWEESRKPFGFEKFPLRFGGLSYRLRYAEQLLTEYLSGERAAIEELAEPRIPNMDKHKVWACDFMQIDR